MSKKFFCFVLMGILIIFSACTNQQPASILPTAGPFDETTQLKVEELDEYFQDMADKGDFSGATIVFQDGVILLNKGYGYADREKQIQNSHQTRFRLNHATMPFTAMAVWMLYDQGKLHYEDPICGYIENCPETWKETTILDLLNRTSRIPDYTLFLKPMDQPATMDELVKKIKELPLEPYINVTGWNGDSDFILLASIIEKASNQKYETYIQENILNPLGLTNTGLINGDGQDDKIAIQYRGTGDTNLSQAIDMSNLHAAAGMYSTVEDAYLFLDAVINKKILNSENINVLTEGNDLLDYWTNNTNQVGSGWYTFDYYGKTYASSLSDINYYGSFFAYRPATNSGFIILVNQDATPILWGTSIVPILEEWEEPD